MKLPEKWNDFTVEECVGAGAFGEVYKVSRKLGNQMIFSAVKVIHVPLAGQEKDSFLGELSDPQKLSHYYEQQADEYLKEVAAMSSLRGNSHIVSVEDFEKEPSKDGIGWDIYIRMEFLQSFRAYLTEHVFTEEDALKLAEDIAEGLVSLQKMNLVHRDIKPDNLFVDALGNYKLGDFGEARFLEQGDETVSFSGSLNYMAPEIQNRKGYDARVDIYSLGVVLYYLTNRRRFPFEDTEKKFLTMEEKAAAYEKRLDPKEKLPNPAEASEEFSKIILHCMAYDPENRYASPEELLQDLRELEDARKEKKNSRTTGFVNTKKDGKFRKQIYAAAAVCVVCLVLIGSFLVRKFTKNEEMPVGNNTVEQQTVLENQSEEIQQTVENVSSENSAEQGNISGDSQSAPENTSENSLAAGDASGDNLTAVEGVSNESQEGSNSSFFRETMANSEGTAEETLSDLSSVSPGWYKDYWKDMPDLSYITNKNLFPGTHTYIGSETEIQARIYVDTDILLELWENGSIIANNTWNTVPMYLTITRESGEKFTVYGSCGSGHQLVNLSNSEALWNALLSGETLQVVMQDNAVPSNNYSFIINTEELRSICETELLSGVDIWTVTTFNDVDAPLTYTAAYASKITRGNLQAGFCTIYLGKLPEKNVFRISPTTLEDSAAFADLRNGQYYKLYVYDQENESSVFEASGYYSEDFSSVIFSEEDYSRFTQLLTTYSSRNICDDLLEFYLEDSTGETCFTFALHAVDFDFE